jgi:Family of unknown function (DUF5681)
MTDDRMTPSATEAAPANYQVGYGKAPASSRFSKGKSGNPSGKPRGARRRIPALNEERLKKIILEEAYRTIEIHEDGRPLTVTMVQAAVRALAIAAVKGKVHAQALLIKLVATVEQQNQELHQDFFEAMVDYKIKWEKELARRQKLGLKLPEPTPHPDHVLIDMTKGTARVDGPWTKEEKALLDECQAAADAEGKDLRDWLIELRGEAARDDRSNEERMGED